MVLLLPSAAMAKGKPPPPASPLVAAIDHCRQLTDPAQRLACYDTAANALVQAAKRGHAVDGSTAYVTNMPCTTCAKALIAAGVKRVVIFSDYHDTLALRFFTKAEVKIDKITMPSKDIHYDLKNYSSAR